MTDKPLDTEEKEMNPLIIYHGNCYDGFTAAWVASTIYHNAEFYPAKYNEEPPNCVQRDVFVLDFSYPREQMEQIAKEAQSILVLDHHKTAREACNGLDFCVFDMERSGAGMTWDHFYPHAPRPDWINRVEDRDLWRFRFQDTKLVHAYIASLPMTFDHWNKINQLSLSEITKRGAAIEQYIQTYIAKATRESREVEIGCHQVVVLNVPYQNASEMAHAMLESHPSVDYAMGYFQRADGKWQYSLRSRESMDVSEVAKSFGGGGHAQAAGFETGELLEELR